MTERVAVKGAHNGARKKRYHTDTTCRHYPDDPERLDKADAEARGMTECKYCAGTAKDPGTPEPLKYIKRVQAND